MRGSAGIAGTRYRAGSAPRIIGSAMGAGACTWYIRHVDLFRRLSDRDASDLSRALSPRRFAAGQLILGTESGGDRIYVTRSGTVRLFQRHPDGREQTVERLAPRPPFGVTGFVWAAPHGA